MDSGRDAAAASDAVISLRLWATCTLREPPPGWLCPIGFKPGVSEAFEGPFVESFEPSDETEKLLVQASQLDWSQVRQLARMPRSLDGRQFASQQLQRSTEEPVQQATTQETLVEASQLYTTLVHVCMWCNKPPRYHDLWHDRRFASQQLEHSSEEPVQQAPPMNVGA